MNTSRFLLRIATFTAMVAFFVPYTSMAIGSVGGGASIQGYSTAEPLDNGTIVELDQADNSRVVISTQDNVENMFGVTVDRNLLPVTLSSSDLENEVFVASSGTYDVLVSSQGGAIAEGDYVTISSINGIAMRAGYEKTTVFGRANEPFDGETDTLGVIDLLDVNGDKTGQVSIGMVSVTIDIRSNPNEKTTKADVPEWLERIGQAIAEKEVSPIRIYLSVGITVATVIAAIVIVYSGVRNGVVSIGRNPMSKKSIFRALLEIILTSFLILIIGLFAVYLLLRL